MEINGRKQEPVRLGTHGENYGNWMSAPVFYMVGALVVLMAALCVISHFIPGMRLLGVLALIAAAAVLILLGWITWIRKNDDRKADRNHFTGTVMGRKSGNYENLQCIGAGGSGIPADHTASVS